MKMSGKNMSKAPKWKSVKPVRPTLKQQLIPNEWSNKKDYLQYRQRENAKMRRTRMIDRAVKILAIAAAIVVSFAVFGCAAKKNKTTEEIKTEVIAKEKDTTAEKSAVRQSEVSTTEISTWKLDLKPISPLPIIFIGANGEKTTIYNASATWERQKMNNARETAKDSVGEKQAAKTAEKRETYEERKEVIEKEFFDLMKYFFLFFLIAAFITYLFNRK